MPMKRGLKQFWDPAKAYWPDHSDPHRKALNVLVSAWDSNCPQHIPQCVEAAQVKAMLAERDQHIEDLTKEQDRLRKVRTAVP
jgi:uncharacterized protein